MRILKPKKYSNNIEIKKDYNQQDFIAIKNYIPKNITKIMKKYEEGIFELNVGDVVFFHKDLIHKSNFNYSNKARPIGIGRFSSSIGKFNRIKPENL